MAYLGAAVSRWAYVEQTMAFFYDYLLAQKGVPQEYGYPVDGLGVASFGAVHSMRTKLDLLYFAIDWRLGPAILEEFKSNVARKIEAASRARNILAHGVVQYSDEHPDALVVMWSGTEIVYRDSDFEAVLEKIKEAEVAVSWFHNKRARQLLQTGS